MACLTSPGEMSFLPSTLRKTMSTITANIRKPDAAALRLALRPEIPVNLTERAAEGQRDPHCRASKSYGLRLRVVGGGCSGFTYDLYFDQKAALDKVRFVWRAACRRSDEPAVSARHRVDYVEGLQGSWLQVQQPNVKSTCGCGSSFNV